MNGFLPPRRMLDAVCADGMGGVRVTTNTPRNVRRDRCAYMIDWVWMAAISYFGKEDAAFAARCARIAHEAFINAAEHGNGGQEKKRIHMLAWPGSRGVLFGIRDEGGYFRSADIKRRFEEREPIPSSRRGAEPKGKGLPIIYGADDIAVATGHKSLYLTMLCEEHERD